MRAVAGAALLALGACAGRPEVDRAAPIEVALAVRPDLSGLRETLCFRDEPPEALIPGTPDAVVHLQSPRPEGRRLPLPILPEGACVALEIDLAGTARDADTAIVPVGSWLWRPADEPVEAPVSLAASGAFLLAPWPGAERRVLSPEVFRRPGLVAFSRRDFPRWRTGFGTLELAAAPARDLPDPGVLERWLRTAAEEVGALFGPLPAGRLPVFVRGEAGGEAIGFGRTFRAGGPAVALSVSPALTDAAARADWTAVHEIFHTGLPVMRSEDAWLYEGLASYYQNVLRARSGRLSAEAAWALLADGFQRGRRTRTGRTLEAESRDMDRTHAYWPVYWGGALWALRADVALRKARPGGAGLDEVMRLWARLGGAGAEPRSALELLQGADAALGTDLLARSARESLGRTDFLEAEAVDPAVWDAITRRGGH